MTSKSIVYTSIHFPFMNGEVAFFAVVLCENFDLGVLINQKLMFDSDLVLRYHPTEQAEAFLDDLFEGLLLSHCIGYIILSLNKDDLKGVHLRYRL